MDDRTARDFGYLTQRAARIPARTARGGARA